MAVKNFFEKKNNMEFIGYDNGVVVCRLLNCESAALNRICKYLKCACICFYPAYDLYEDEMLSSASDKYMIEDVFVGIAKTAPEDDFDPEVGKRLALNRAKRKRGQAINQAVKRFLKDARYSLKTLEENAICDISKTEAAGIRCGKS